MAQTDTIDYDQAAGEYAAHRLLHPGVFRELCVRARVGSDSTVIEIGCGTGNYVRALAHRHRCAAHGLDPSTGMLTRAHAHADTVGWVQGRAEQICFAGGKFDLVFSVDVIHHVLDKALYYGQALRLLRPGGRVCTVTDSEEIIRCREVLSGYFPETVEVELARYPRIVHLEAWMTAAGLVETDVVVVEEPYEVTSAQPFRDKAYSSLHLISHEAWRAGVERLERDLVRGPIRGVSRYACVWGRKPEA